MLRAPVPRPALLIASSIAIACFPQPLFAIPAYREQNDVPAEATHSTRFRGGFRPQQVARAVNAGASNAFDDVGPSGEDVDHPHAVVAVSRVAHGQDEAEKSSKTRLRSTVSQEIDADAVVFIEVNKNEVGRRTGDRVEQVATDKKRAHTNTMKIVAKKTQENVEQGETADDDKKNQKSVDEKKGKRSDDGKNKAENKQSDRKGDEKSGEGDGEDNKDLKATMENLKDGEFPYYLATPNPVTVKGFQDGNPVCLLLQPPPRTSYYSTEFQDADKDGEKATEKKEKAEKKCYTSDVYKVWKSISDPKALKKLYDRYPVPSESDTKKVWVFVAFALGVALLFLTVVVLLYHSCIADKIIMSDFQKELYVDDQSSEIVSRSASNGEETNHFDKIKKQGKGSVMAENVKVLEQGPPTSSKYEASKYGTMSTKISKADEEEIASVVPKPYQNQQRRSAVEGGGRGEETSSAAGGGDSDGEGTKQGAGGKNKGKDKDSGGAKAERDRASRTTAAELSGASSASATRSSGGGSLDPIAEVSPSREQGGSPTPGGSPHRDVERPVVNQPPVQKVLAAPAAPEVDATKNAQQKATKPPAASSGNMQISKPRVAPEAEGAKVSIAEGEAPGTAGSAPTSNSNPEPEVATTRVFSGANAIPKTAISVVNKDPSKMYAFKRSGSFQSEQKGAAARKSRSSEPPAAAAAASSEKPRARAAGAGDNKNAEADQEPSKGDKEDEAEEEEAPEDEAVDEPSGEAEDEDAPADEADDAPASEEEEEEEEEPSAEAADEPAADADEEPPAEAEEEEPAADADEEPPAEAEEEEPASDAEDGEEAAEEEEEEEEEADADADADAEAGEEPTSSVEAAPDEG